MSTLKPDGNGVCKDKFTQIAQHRLKKTKTEILLEGERLGVFSFSGGGTFCGGRDLPHIYISPGAVDFGPHLVDGWQGVQRSKKGGAVFR